MIAPPDSNDHGSGHAGSHMFTRCGEVTVGAVPSRTDWGSSNGRLPRGCIAAVYTTPHRSHDAHPRPQHRSSWTISRTRPHTTCRGFESERPWVRLVPKPVSEPAGWA